MATPRQYRPTYEYNYRKPPLVRSTSGLIRFPPSPPRVKIKKDPIPTTYDERRTTSIFPKPIPAYSAPTTARTGLTVSASLGDLSRSSNMASRLRFPNLRRATPTRIPSPIVDKSPGIFGTPRRYVSTPVIGSARKENAEPKTHRLLRPISPARLQPVHALPKSKTMSMLTNMSNFSLSNVNLTGSRNSSFSRSTAHLSSRKSSGYSSQTGEPTTSESTSTPPLPIFTTNGLHILGAQHNSYWCGRFQAVHDRFHLDNLEITNLSQEEFRKHVSLEGDYKEKSARRKFKSKKSSPNDETTSEASVQHKKSRFDAPKFAMEEEEERCKRVFDYLDGLCMNEDARQSLWDFQQRYARRVKCESLLPMGGTMVDVKEGWVSRLGRAIRGSSESGRGVASSLSLGRRSGFAVLGRSRKEKIW